VCGEILSQCTDNVKNYICDVCGVRLPCIIVTVPDGCLVNGDVEDVAYQVDGPMIILLTYVKNDNKTVTAWILYNSEGEEVATLIPNELYTISVEGIYYAVPVFE
jgi:hypothetical protein